MGAMLISTPGCGAAVIRDKDKIPSATRRRRTRILRRFEDWRADAIPSTTGRPDMVLAAAPVRLPSLPHPSCAPPPLAPLDSARAPPPFTVRPCDETSIGNQLMFLILIVKRNTHVRALAIATASAHLCLLPTPCSPSFSRLQPPSSAAPACDSAAVKVGNGD